MYTAIIAFGSNLENPTQQVLQAAQRVAQQPEIIQFILSIVSNHSCGLHRPTRFHQRCGASANQCIASNFVGVAAKH